MLSGFWPPSPTSSTFGYPFSPLLVNVICKWHKILPNIYKCETFMIFIKCVKCQWHSSFWKIIWIISKSKNFLRSFTYKMFCVVLRLWHVHKKVLYKFIDIVQQVNFGTGMSTIWAYIDNLAASISGRGESVRLIFLTARILMIQIMQLTFFTAFYKKLCEYTVN